MKVAVVTTDDKSVGQHFGRSRYYKKFTVADGKIIDSELMERKTGHFAPGGPQHDPNEPHQDAQGRHGFGQAATNRHASMAAELEDCKVLIVGGMGAGAYQNFTEAGLDVYLTDHQLIDKAVKDYLAGTLQNLYEQRTD